MDPIVSDLGQATSVKMRSNPVSYQGQPADMPRISFSTYLYTVVSVCLLVLQKRPAYSLFPIKFRSATFQSRLLLPGEDLPPRPEFVFLYMFFGCF